MRAHTPSLTLTGAATRCPARWCSAGVSAAVHCSLETHFAPELSRLIALRQLLWDVVAHSVALTSCYCQLSPSVSTLQPVASLLPSCHLTVLLGVTTRIKQKNFSPARLFLPVAVMKIDPVNLNKFSLIRMTHLLRPCLLGCSSQIFKRHCGKLRN